MDNLQANIDLANLQRSTALAGQAARGISHGKPRNAREAAEAFEAIFLSQMLAPMFKGIPTDTIMGGGHAEKIYRSMMVEEIGKSIARAGGVGIADSVHRELLSLQEAANDTDTEPIARPGT